MTNNCSDSAVSHKSPRCQWHRRAPFNVVIIFDEQFQPIFIVSSSGDQVGWNFIFCWFWNWNQQQLRENPRYLLFSVHFQPNLQVFHQHISIGCMCLQNQGFSATETPPIFSRNISHFSQKYYVFCTKYPYFYSFLPNEILLFFLRSNTSGFFINSYAFFAVFVYWQVWAGNPAASLTQQWYFICSPPNLMCTLCSHPLRKCTRRTVRKFNLCRYIA